MCGSTDDVILSADSFLETNNPLLDSNFNQAQIDLMQFVNIVLFFGLLFMKAKNAGMRRVIIITAGIKLNLSQ